MGNNSSTKSSDIKEVHSSPTRIYPPSPDLHCDPLLKSHFPNLPDSCQEFLQSLTTSFHKKSLILIKDQEKLIKSCENLESLTSDTFLNQSQRLSLLSTKLKKVQIQADFSIIKESLNCLQIEIKLIEEEIYKLDDLILSGPKNIE